MIPLTLPHLSVFRPLRFVAFIALAATIVLRAFAAEARWEEVIERRTLDQGLLLENRSNVLVRGCTISNPSGRYGIRLVNCRNVRIENCVIRRIGNESMQEKNIRIIREHRFVPVVLDHVAAIDLFESRDVQIIDNDITDSASKGITAAVRSATVDDPIRLLIEGNRIAYIYDDGIDFNTQQGASKDGTRLNLRDVTIRRNLIHDIGLGLTRLGFARHGMYLSARDVLVEDNTIYNCYYGEGISIRNSAIVRNNTVRNCARACISYWAQGQTTGGTQEVVIEGNRCSQDFTLPLPMRHIGSPEKLHQLPLGVITVQYSDNPATLMKSVVVRNNALWMGRDVALDIPLIGGNGDPKKNTASLRIEDNRLVDRRAKVNYFELMPQSVDLSKNTLLTAGLD